jgi:hypothetical protein
MSRCEICGAPFFGGSTSWGDRACGDCLADRIELALMHHTLDDQRKPMRKATATEEPHTESLRAQGERRSA